MAPLKARKRKRWGGFGREVPERLNTSNECIAERDPDVVKLADAMLGLVGLQQTEGEAKVCLLSDGARRKK